MHEFLQRAGITDMQAVVIMVVVIVCMYVLSEWLD